MPAQSEVSICNYGLTMLSTSRIESLTQNDENARKCNAIYSFIRDALLEDGDWGFARVEASLALLATDPTTEDWEYKYQLPTDCLAVRHMDGSLPYKVFADTLFTNHTSPLIIYTTRIEDPSKFTPKFALALGAKMAEALAFGITQNASMAKVASDEAKRKVDEAKWSDAQQGLGNVPIVGDLIRQREL